MELWSKGMVSQDQISFFLGLCWCVLSLPRDKEQGCALPAPGAGSRPCSFSPAGCQCDTCPVSFKVALGTPGETTKGDG